MIIDGDLLDNGTIIDTQVCIVGGGGAGITLALELQKRLSDVVLLESGGEQYTPEAQQLYEAAKKADDYPDPSFSRLRFLGGATNHWANNTSPLDPIDFERRDWVPHSGWPITYQDLDDYYRRAGSYCGVGEDGYDTDYWVRQLGMQDVVAKSTMFETGMAKASSPPVRFYTEFKQGLKDSASIRVYMHANFVDTSVNEDGVVTEVIFKSLRDPGKTHKVRARTVVFCMGGLENARMLLHINRNHSGAIGNSGDNIGRYFMDHPLPRAAVFHAKDKNLYDLYQGYNFPNRMVLGFFKIPREQLISNQLNNLRMPLSPASNYLLSDGISSYHLLTASLERGELIDNFGMHVANIFSDADMVGEAISRRVFDKKIFARAQEFGGFNIPMTMEQTPDRDNRVELSDVTDRFGIPQIALSWRVTQDDKDRLWRSLEFVARGVGAASLGRLRLLREREDRMWASQLGFGHHHMGTTRMAETASAGVVDRNHKVFGSKNLYMAGSSVFSTGGHVPPTLTIVALSIRLAEHLAQEVNNA